MATSKPLKMESMPYQVWKEKPPGPEQKELERMFDCKEISAAATADSVRKSNKLFHKFSASVFSSHFRKTRARYGLGTAVDLDGSAIPELGSPSKPQSSSERNEIITIDDNPNESNSSIACRNLPYSTWVYTNHAKKSDFVCVALLILSGVRKTTFSLSEDGNKVSINFLWPTPTFKASELFGEAIQKNELSLSDPKVHAFVSTMLEKGITENSAPQAQIIIELPCQVKREIGSWTQTAIKVSDCKIMLLEFTAYQKSLLVDDADTSLTF